MVEVTPVIASQASSDTPRLSSAYATTTERFVVFLDIMGFKDYELDWYPKSCKEMVSEDNLERCLECLRLTVSDEPRKYIDNTLDIFLANNGATTTSR